MAKLNAAEVQLCNNFRAVREALGLTLARASGLTGINVGTLSLVENCKQAPSGTVIKAFCKTLHIDEEYLRSRRICVEVA